MIHTFRAEQERLSETHKVSGDAIIACAKNLAASVRQTGKTITIRALGDANEEDWTEWPALGLSDLQVSPKWPDDPNFTVDTLSDCSLLIKRKPKAEESAYLPAPTRPQVQTPAREPGAKSTPKVKDGFAHTIEASDWENIEVKVLATGIKFRKTGTEEWQTRNWGAMGLEGKRMVCGLLIRISKYNGTLPNLYKEKRYDATHDLNSAFKVAFGLAANPFANHRRMGTQSCLAAISWGGR